MEFLIGKIGGRLPQKYIIVKQGEVLMYFAENRYSEIGKMHSRIAFKNKIRPRDVLGGGFIERVKGGIEFIGNSADFGGVPMEFLQKNKSVLLKKYRVGKLFLYEEFDAEVRWEKWGKVGFSKRPTIK